MLIKSYTFVFLQIVLPGWGDDKSYLSVNLIILRIQRKGNYQWEKSAFILGGWIFGQEHEGETGLSM